MPKVQFAAKPYTNHRWMLLRLPEHASRVLPSRGQVAVTGTISGWEFRTVLEPDGRSGHWMRIDDGLRRAAGVTPGDVVQLELETTKEWPEPTVPADLDQALGGASEQVRAVWLDITPMARWEWVRWVNATSNAETRQRRIEVTVSKLNSGKRRPCCFDLSACTDPHLSKGGKLVDAS
ncbi:MAG: YdeI/OmpD-associated family protein [Candidatus Dormibacteria bacterium]